MEALKAGIPSYCFWQYSYFSLFCSSLIFTKFENLPIVYEQRENYFVYRIQEPEKIASSQTSLKTEKFQKHAN